ncbi:MAG: metallophosphoesterase [Candidatus Omnitrophica bacterium]|nr:metallophosphoesterase [Candidatus Omnitrophota bacterium]MDD5672323.1 metallophosphoesterase [Candidatus Omnitrophota bacterium]
MKKKVPVVFWLVLALMTAAVYPFLEPFWLKCTRVEISLPDEYQALDGTKIMQIADLHLRTGLGFNEAKVIAWARRNRPDLIAITGDFIETPGVRDAFFNFLSFLPKVPKFAVLGNWERWVRIDPRQWKRLMLERDTELLTNESTRVHVRLGGIVVAGVDDAYTHRADIGKTLRGCPEGYRILLTHSPEIFDEPGITGFNLVLAAHCHNGQIRLPWYGPLWLPHGCEKYVYGLFRKNGTWLYVTSGVGTSLLPMRFLARPEVVMLVLKAERKKETIIKKD